MSGEGWVHFQEGNRDSSRYIYPQAIPLPVSLHLQVGEHSAVGEGSGRGGNTQKPGHAEPWVTGSSFVLQKMGTLKVSKQKVTLSGLLIFWKDQDPWKKKKNKVRSRMGREVDESSSPGPARGHGKEPEGRSIGWHPRGAAGPTRGEWPVAPFPVI